MASTIDPTSKTGGLLLAAFESGQVDEIAWVDVAVGDLMVTVAADALKAPLGDRQSVRLPVSYAEAITICKGLACVSPTQAIADAMYAQATAKLVLVALPPTSQMNSVKWTLDFDDGVAKQMAKDPTEPADLVFGAWKLWILHPRIVEKGAVNYGFWDASGKTIQTVGGQHNDQHYDYSQLLQPVKRLAKSLSTGEPVDLLDRFGTADKIPASYLSPYEGS